MELEREASNAKGRPGFESLKPKPPRVLANLDLPAIKHPLNTLVSRISALLLSKETSPLTFGSPASAVDPAGWEGNQNNMKEVNQYANH
jgi:hypothetical protein